MVGCSTSFSKKGEDRKRMDCRSLSHEVLNSRFHAVLTMVPNS
jgi:hypothetical protein